jgi:hypothetical protein
MVEDIEKLYPAERIARSKERVRAAWDLAVATDRIPFVYSSLPLAKGETPFDIWDGMYTHEESLAAQLETIIDRAKLDDDYVPSLYPGCRQGTIPTAYGAEECRGGNHTWVRPMLDSPDDVFALGRADFRTDGVAAEILDRIRYFRSATDGRLPIQLADMQGPLDLASNMWGTEPLLVAMQTSPEAAHALLQLMTDAFIEYVHLMVEAAEGDLIPIHCMPVNWMPIERGVGASEDLLAVISPRLYAVFGRPYNEQIARELGGVVIHSCGSVEHNLEALAATRGLTGVNFGATETSLPAVIDAVGGRATIISHYGDVTCNDLPALTPGRHVELCADLFKSRRVSGMIVVMPLGIDREEALDLCPEITRLARVDGA